jgi:hypothetical protein
MSCAHRWLAVLSLNLACSLAAAADSATFTCEYRVRNPDGSVTCAGARYIPSDEQRTVAAPSLRFHFGSGSSDSICRFMGFDRTVGADDVEESMDAWVVELDSLGEPEKMRPNIWFANSLFATVSGGLVLENVVCARHDAVAVPSRQYKRRIRNADGSVTIERPEFDYTSYPTPIDGESKQIGVCKLFGFGRFVRAEIDETFFTSSTAARIGSDGKLDELIRQSQKTIQRIVCAD